MNLSDCMPGITVRVLKVNPQHLISMRLMELGFLEGATVEVLHEAPFSKDPMAVRVRGSLIALRRSEASLIAVEKVGP